MLRAIAIYDRKDDGEFDQVQAAQKPGSLFFSNTALSDFKKTILPQLVKDEKLFSGEKMFSNKCEEGFYYADWIPETNHLLVVISERELFDVEPRYLLINVNHVDQRSDKVATTLLDILRNPLGYTGRDILTEALKRNVDDLKVEVINTKNILLERGSKIENLNEQSERLFASSVEFRERSEELKDSYTCCGGVKNYVKESTDKLRIVNNTL